MYVPIRAAAGIRWAGVAIGGLGALATVFFAVRATLKARKNAAEPDYAAGDYAAGDGDYYALTLEKTAGKRAWNGGGSVQ